MSDQALRAVEIPQRVASIEPSPGPAPMLEWLQIAKLRLDDAYQRDLRRENWNAIKRIAESFKWSCFSPVFVAPIDGGLFAVIDGQHRTHAAAICGFKTVPCQIVQMDRAAQAAAFAAVNGTITRVTTFQVYRAALTAEEPWAVDIHRISTDAGCIVMSSNRAPSIKKPREIYAISAMRRLSARYEHKIVTQALKGLAVSDGFGDVPEAWVGGVLMPILRALCQRAAAINSPGFRSAFEQWDFWSEIDQVEERVKRSRRLGLPSASKSDLLETCTLTWLDNAFPPALGLPAPAMVDEEGS